MKICDYRGFEMHMPTSGGKAGHGYNATGSIQVRFDNCLKANFRFKMDSDVSRKNAVSKAKAFVDRQEHVAKEIAEAGE